MFFPIFPALEYSTYVSAVADNGTNNATIVLGGFPEGQPASLGDAGSAIPGTLSFSYGDLMTTAPGTYAIARFTFPQGLIPTMYPFSQISTVNPDVTILPWIPEPNSLCVVALAGLLALRPSARRPTRRLG
jgi:hypothetical protein